MSNPRRDYFEIDTLLDGIADKIMAHAVMGEWRQVGSFAGLFYRVLGAADSDHERVVVDLVASSQSF